LRESGPSVRDLGAICARRAELLRELAGLEEALASAVAAAAQPAARDEILNLKQAAAYLGEPERTVQSRLEYRKALVSRPGEYRLRFSRAELDRIIRDRLMGNGGL
jgi:hypothetical protein